jgi:hypothetical protein
MILLAHYKTARHQAAIFQDHNQASTVRLTCNPSAQHSTACATLNVIVRYQVPMPGSSNSSCKFKQGEGVACNVPAYDIFPSPRSCALTQPVGAKVQVSRRLATAAHQHCNVSSSQHSTRKPGSNVYTLHTCEGLVPVQPARCRQWGIKVIVQRQAHIIYQGVVLCVCVCGGGGVLRHIVQHQEPAWVPGCSVTLV